MITTAYLVIQIKIEHPELPIEDFEEITDILDYVGSELDYNIEFKNKVCNDQFTIEIIDTQLLECNKEYY